MDMTFDEICIDAGPDWLFVAVPDGKVVKNRTHFDFRRGTSTSASASRTGGACRSGRQRVLAYPPRPTDPFRPPVTGRFGSPMAMTDPPLCGFDAIPACHTRTIDGRADRRGYQAGRRA
jgi:hypothetical protein